MNGSSNLLIRKENYRLWFEFYKICHMLRRDDVNENLNKSAIFYEQWNDVTNIKFDEWWKSHSKLFVQPIVRIVKSEDDMESPFGILIEVPLNQSITDTLFEIKVILTKEQKKSNKKRKKI